MTYRSASRGIMYTAPPSGDETDRDGRTDRATDAAPEVSADEEHETKGRETKERDANETADAERETPSLDPTTATTDANWTGTVPADD